MAMFSREKTLFRQQAIEFVSARQYGTVILGSHSGHNILTWFIFLIAIAIIVFFICFNTTRKVETVGMLLPSGGLIRVQPGQLGVVRKVCVNEGQKVNAGDLLFILSNERNISAKQSAESAVSMLLQYRRDSYNEELAQVSQQSNLRIVAAQKRVVALLEESARLQSQISLQKSRVELVTQAFKRFRDLYAENYISSAQIEDKEAELLDQRQKLAELERLKVANERDYISAQADYADLKYQLKRDEEALKRNALSIQQDITESQARQEIKVTAPTAGTVSTITVEVGKSVAADSTLTSILPVDSKLEAEIYAPSRAIGFVKPGMKVLLRYQAYPYQKFGQYEATVREIATTPVSSHEHELSDVAIVTSQASEPLYRIRLRLKQQEISLYNKRVELKPGMLLNASVVLEHRRLYEWILEPLYSIARRN
jgi:membrane fusion protein